MAEQDHSKLKEKLVLDLFSDQELSDKGDGQYRTNCPYCEEGSGPGFMLNPPAGIGYCHRTQKWHGLLELYALKARIHACHDGRDEGQSGHVLSREQFKETMKYIRELGPDTEASVHLARGSRPQIQAPKVGKLHGDFAKEVAPTFAANKTLFYRPNTRDICEVNGGEIWAVKPARFVSLIERYYEPFVLSGKKKEDATPTPCSLKISDANIILESPQLQNELPKLERVFTVPLSIVREGKLTFPREGYDPRFNSWLPKNAPKIQPDMPLKDAKQWIEYILQDFCFSEEQDRTNAIAGLLTPFLRGLYTSFSVRSPLFIYLANRERAGKDYLAGITGVLMEGVSIEQNPISTGEYRTSGSNEELRKGILAAVLAGRNRLHFSNNKGLINSAVLEALLTNRQINDRILGRSENVNLPNELDISLSGNVGINMTPDLCNRARFVNLHLGIENANDREFTEPNLHGFVLNHRSEILSALYAFVRHWHEQGSPEGSVPFASFPEWASICGGILETVGYGTPCKDGENLAVGVGLDTNTENMRELFTHMYDLHGEEYIHRNTIIDTIKNPPTNEEDGPSIFGFWNFDDHGDKIKFGKIINKFIGRELGGIMLQVKDRSQRPHRYQYKFTKNTTKNNNLGSVGSVGSVAIPSKYMRARAHVRNDPKNTANTANTAKKEKPGNDDGSLVDPTRKTPFYDDPVTQQIKPTATETDVLAYIRQNPGCSDEEILQGCGNGSIPCINGLIRGGHVERADGGYGVK